MRALSAEETEILRMIVRERSAPVNDVTIITAADAAVAMRLVHRGLAVIGKALSDLAPCGWVWFWRPTDLASLALRVAAAAPDLGAALR